MMSCNGLEDDSKMYILYHHEKLGMNDIAKELGRSKGSVQNRMSSKGYYYHPPIKDVKRGVKEMDEKERQQREVEAKLAYVLASVYIRIPWRKIGVKSAHTFFIERVRAASRASNIKKFIESLEKKVEVPMAQIETQYIDLLEENRAYALNVLRKETNYIVMLALENVDKLKEARKLKKQGQETL